MKLDDRAIAVCAALLVLIVVALWIDKDCGPAGAQVPPRPGQPHPDIFQVDGIANLQEHNPTNVKAKDRRTVSYRLLTMSGCLAGTVPDDMAVLARELERVAFRLVRDDAAPDFTVRINCGSEQIRICGSVNVFCLGRDFPRIADVEVSDIISAWPVATRVSILCHEICGHAIATWNEQYCLGTEASGACAGAPRFTPAQGWSDFMNTGSESRHGFEAVELERWERTMYLIAPTQCAAVGFDPCTGRWFEWDGWSWDPATGIWWNPAGQPEWSACNADRVRWNHQIAVWAPPGSGFFRPERGFWSFAPAC